MSCEKSLDAKMSCDEYLDDRCTTEVCVLCIFPDKKKASQFRQLSVRPIKQSKLSVVIYVQGLIFAHLPIDARGTVWLHTTHVHESSSRG